VKSGLAGVLAQLQGRTEAAAPLKSADLFECNPAPMWVHDVETSVFLAVNRAALEHYGYAREELIGKGIDTLLSPHPDLGAMVEAFAGIASIRSHPVFKHRKKSGEEIYVELRSYDVRADGRDVRVVCAEDVTSQVHAEQLLVQSQSALARGEQIAHLGSYAYNYATGIAYWSDEVYRILRAPVGIVDIHAGLLPFCHVEDIDRVRMELARSERAREPYDVEHRVVRHDGTTAYVQHQGHCVFDDDGGVIAQFGTLLDITDRRITESSLRELAFHDALTGLRNRTGLRADIRRLIGEHRGDSLIAVLFVDLDRFKIINDTLGHRVGDAVLAEVSRRLKSAAGTRDVAARTGGDEFIIVLSDMPDKMEIARRAMEILQVLAPPIAVGEHQHFVGASIGISLFPLDGSDPDALLRNADVAMYDAKRGGGASFSFYTPQQQYAASRKFRIERALRQALARNELAVHYQPILDRSGSIAAVEALLRWNSLELGPIEPAQFIPLADEAGMMVEIGRWAIKHAFEQCAHWMSLRKDVLVWINASLRQLLDRAFIQSIEELLQAYSLPPQLIGFEISETVFGYGHEEAHQVLRALRAMGICIALGDFGVRSSSLAMLQDLPLDALKIDRRFVENLERNTFSSEAASVIVRLARAIGVRVTGEGVETQEQLRRLLDLGCDFWQGSLFSDARDASEITRLLRHH
jgi:diguanylate cyclase (GGDEF)-like protein/PAS domain S-box-containing protein